MECKAAFLLPHPSPSVRLIAVETGKKYDKADAGFQRVLEPRVEMALINARRLAFENERLHQARLNPSTLVHELVDALIQPDRAAKHLHNSEVKGVSSAANSSSSTNLPPADHLDHHMINRSREFQSQTS